MFKPNDIIGPYILCEKLGRGAFGVVWLASKRTALSEHQVALKMPASDEVDLDAIRLEANVWEAAKGHPNIVPIIEADVYNGQVVIASEFVPDGSLGDWLRQNGGVAPHLEAAINMTLGILAGLEHLHARRIIHRDLKPANILLQANTPRLADFGLARCLKSTNSSSTVSGTFAYMAPEAFDGKRMAQSDLWATGVMLYQMLAGRLPFPQTESPALLAAILTQEPESLPENVPDEVRAVVLRALRKDPAERYANAAEISAALRAAYHRQLVSASQPTAVIDSALVMSVAAGPATVREVAAVTEVMPSPRQSRKARLALVAVAVAVVALLLTGGIVLSRRWAGTEAKKKTPFVKKVGSAPPLDGKTPHTEELPDGAQLKLVAIPPGSFMMGAPLDEGRSEREGPPHRVAFKHPFYLSQYEVTQAQWQAVIGDNPARFADDLQRPVENVNWVEAQEFCRRLSDMTGRHYRLPTEAEWEYAARAGTTGPYAGDVDALAWYDTNSGGTPQPVGRKQPNAFGIYDMHGNIAEWCEDVWHDDYQNAPNDGSAWLTGGDARVRILRGGSWGSGPRVLRSAYRSDNFGADVRSNLIGFRVATDAK